jgi:cytochrome oxidase Cu insertion factor (SCO1/SenC/PrrC family)
MDAGASLGSRLAPGRIAAVVAVAALLGTAIGVGLHFVVLTSTTRTVPSTAGAPGLHGAATWAPGTRPAPPITTLHDQTGRPFALSALHGRTVLIGFVDSLCTQACPLEGRALASAVRALPRARRPVLVLVSVNPRDTPASTRAAMRRWGLARLGAWHWLRGSHAQLAPVWHAYRIFVAPAKGDIVHTEAIYLLDRHGNERSAYLYPFLPRSVGADLRALA